MSKTKHILGLSGGKDSAALAVHMNNKYPDLDIEYFFTDTGYELEETYDFLNKLKTRLDKPIHYINPRNSFDYYLKKYNNFLPSQTARWCTIEMKLKSMETWLKPALDEGQEIITYVGIRYDERGRVGYKPTNDLIKAKFPFIEDCIDKEGVIEILESSGLGLPDYYKWRSRSGCTFCFFQKRSEWIGLKENHPKAWEHAKSLEKQATENASAFTWIKDMPLTELEKPEMIAKVKEQHKKQMEKLKKNKQKIQQNNPFLKGEDLNIEENLALDDVSSSCLICHK
ncbi:phosphoadenosine phosphosulfate reductase family protein [Candidatus Pelagibacter sp. HIMB1709]|uniref:phosphoadenosine phosphosulfate reductase family protein n=1 Tax=Candidatus Pelagibacter sp. HIMB1709 TaxID=3413367 RepID=UPI003F83CF32